MVVAVIVGVVNEFPEAKRVFPVCVAYQLITPPLFAIAFKVTVPAPHLLFEVTLVTS